MTVLRLRGITKRFGSLVANDNISLSLKAGEVLALLGENGAGKSTLVSILFGHYVADAGGIEVHGQPLPPGQPKAALDAGIGMVHQHFTLADNLSVLDNVMLGTEPLWRPASRRAVGRQRLLDLSRRFGLAVVPDAQVGSLSVGERQRVEILKALYRGARVLILDEPTAVLTPQESEQLFATLDTLVKDGLAVIFISHKLDEVLRVSSRVAVLRGGKLVAECAAQGTTKAELAAIMVGREVKTARRVAASGPPSGAVVLLGKGLHTAAGDHGTALRGVDLSVHAGEIVAVAGVSGNGQVALAKLLHGLLPVAQGRLEIAGKRLKAKPRDWVSLPVARIPEDRHAQGVVGDLSLWENTITERLFDQRFARWGWVRRVAARAHARRIIEHFDVRGGGLDMAARRLSGGNMQKLVLGRALALGEGTVQGVPTLIVAAQPTWGLDIGAVAFVHEQLIRAAEQGSAVLLISEDLDEILALADRIAVMHEGHLTEARPRPSWTLAKLGLAMAGSDEALPA
ncbi:ABC transporter ATP-binding protein [Aquabacterium sp.]|uniref:ABC transporter ATP-binding protein n=1 Tax=Aquabacterium sp. TaxID=1872578 RepID=UPI003D6D1B49